MGTLQPIRFGVFQVDFAGGELRRKGRKVKLQDQPFQLLTCLLQNPGGLVTREELRQKLWPSDTFVDFETGLNVAVMKLRQALGDTAARPHFIETVPRRGYRFIGQLEDAPEMRPSSQRPPGGLPVPVAPAGGGSGRSRALAPEPVKLAPRLVPFPLVRPRKRLWRAFAWGACATLCAGLLVYTLRPLPAPKVLGVKQLTHVGRVLQERVVTDGVRAYFTEIKGGRLDIAQVSVEGGESSTLPLPFSSTTMGISPDGLNLLVTNTVRTVENRLLWILPAAGGEPRRLGNIVADYADWSPDGKQIAFTRGSEIDLVNADGSGPRKLADLAGRRESAVFWSPDGGLLSCSVLNPADDIRSLWEVRTDGAGARPMLHNWSKAAPQAWEGEFLGAWTPDGQYFVFASVRGKSSSLWALRRRAHFWSRTPSSPFLLYTTPNRIWQVAAGKHGRKVFFVSSQDQRELTRYDSRSAEFTTYLGGLPARYISFSRDGRRAAYTTWPAEELWLRRLDSTVARKLMFASISRSFYSSWSPDGTRIAVDALLRGEQGIYLVPVEGGAPQKVAARDVGAHRPNWFPQGNALLYSADTPPDKAKPHLRVLDLDTREDRAIPGSEGLTHAALSPDGRQVAALLPDGTKLVLFDLKSRRRRTLASGAAFSDPYWSRDGAYVYFQDFLLGPAPPIFRVRARDGGTEQVTHLREQPPDQAVGYRLVGLAPDDSVLAGLILNNSDLFSLDVQFP
ncbi:MAG TPA: LpqB family beta-propeller domain-containing protein [Terriglobia bacterium]|nr:LpqB family beta-propeller domain-containing protein [Terriglobia bacterium]